MSRDFFRCVLGPFDCSSGNTFEVFSQIGFCVGYRAPQLTAHGNGMVDPYRSMRPRVLFEANTFNDAYTCIYTGGRYRGSAPWLNLFMVDFAAQMPDKPLGWLESQLRTLYNGNLFTPRACDLSSRLNRTYNDCRSRSQCPAEVWRYYTITKSGTPET